jgi:short-subunit dehydrogenase
MARIFITGSSDGLGSMAAKLLVNQGHEIVLHARNAERGRQSDKSCNHIAGFFPYDFITS